MRNIRYFLELFARWAIVTLFISLLLFGAAGTTGVSSMRRYAVTFSALLIVTMLSVDPGLAQERSRTFERAATQGRLGAGLSFLATLGCAAMDVGRLHWLDSVPPETQLGSLLLFVAATSLQTWAMIGQSDSQSAKVRNQLLRQARRRYGQARAASWPSNHLCHR